jgi:L-ascorbate metabolism protein UlaG (beta-lactamase superfamily)
MEIERLAWAGVRLAAGDTVVAIDVLGDSGFLAPLMGPPRHDLGRAADPGSLTTALVTHVHPDHRIANPGAGHGCGLAVGAGMVVPIHVGTFDFPPSYADFRDAETAFVDTASGRGLAIRVFGQGETFHAGPGPNDSLPANGTGRGEHW